MAATYTFDVFATLDGYGSYGPGRRLGRLLGQAAWSAGRAVVSLREQWASTAPR